MVSLARRERERVNEAWPLPSTGTFEASTVAPSVNVALPTGTPAAGWAAVMVAVKLTDWPNPDGLSDDATAVLVASWTDCVVELLLLSQPPVPVKLAVM